MEKLKWAVVICRLVRNSCFAFQELFSKVQRLVDLNREKSIEFNVFHFQIVLIDEGTSNLDNDTEMILQLVLKNAFKTSTVLIIAHRLNGLQNVDRMIVIDNGKIAEMGPPQELASFSDSLLSKMLDEQRVLTFRK